jgi:plastocyanin domain-containing protein
MLKIGKIGAHFMILLMWGAIASLPVEAMPKESHGGEFGQFSKIEQPLAVKLGVTLGGIALIGFELWWFMFGESGGKKPTEKSAE